MSGATSMNGPEDEGPSAEPPPVLGDRPAAALPGEGPASRAREIFIQALRRTDADGRQRYLDEACAAEPTLRALVVSLLEAHAQAGDFLEQTVLGDPCEPEAEGAGTVIGPYKLLEQIGEGGFGTVYVAEQETPVRRRVALKLIKLGMDTRSVIARFEAERQALALMDHPNIARIYDAGATAGGRPYFVMELVRGTPVTQFCAEHRLDTRQRLELFLQVCHAVQHAHQKGIIHRDLKPSNVLVTLHDATPVPKVIDFGVAKATEGRLTDKTLYTAWERLIGTPAYMSPEQARLSGLDVDSRSDIYSLGVLLYQLLTDTTPFDTHELLQSGLDEMRRIICEREPLRPSTRRTRGRAVAKAQLAARQSKLETDLDWIVMKCLEKDRVRRYATANGLAMDLQRHLNHEPVLARPPSVAYQLRKWARRHRAGVALGSVVAVAVVAVAVMAAMAAKRERDNAERLQHGLAREYLHRGQALCERGKLVAGLHWLVQSLETAPPASVALKQVAEENLVAWSRQWVEPEAVLFHDSLVYCGAFTPDGRQVVTGDLNGGLTAWSVPSGERLWQRKAHRQVIEHLNLIVSPNGTRVLTGSADGTARLWSTATGDPLGQPMHRTGVGRVGFSPDGRRVFAGGGTNAARLYSAQTGEPLTPPLPHEGGISSHAFSPDGTLLVTGSADRSARCWRVETGERVDPVLHHDTNVVAVAFSPDGQVVATGCLDGTVRFWSVSTGVPRRPLMRHEDRINALAFHPDGTSLLTASADGTARLWSTATGEPIGKSMRHDAPVYAASFSPAGSQVLTAALDSTARRWSAQTAEPLGLPLRHRGTWVIDAAFSADSQHIFTMSTSLEVYLWPGTVMNPPTPTLPGARSGSAQFTPDGKVIAVANWWPPGQVTFWDATTGSELPPAIAHAGGVWSVSFSPDGRHLATAGRDGAARLWDLRSRQPLDLVLRHDGDVRRVAWFAKDRVATASFDRTARIWSATDGSLLKSFDHPDYVEDFAFSSDATRLVTACKDGAVRVWSLGTGEQILPPLRQVGSLVAVALSPEGLIAAGGRERVVRFWNLKDGRQTDIVLEHEGQVDDVDFSPDGRWLLTASRDSTVRLWSVATGEQIGPSLVRGAYPLECAFRPDGKRVVLADSPGATLLDLPVFPDRRFPHARLWIEVITRMQMDEQGIVTWLGLDDWSAKTEQLEKLGGRPAR